MEKLNNYDIEKTREVLIEEADFSIIHLARSVASSNKDGYRYGEIHSDEQYNHIALMKVVDLIEHIAIYVAPIRDIVKTYKDLLDIYHRDQQEFLNIVKERYGRDFND